MSKANFPGQTTRNISELLENRKCAKVVAVYKQYHNHQGNRGLRQMLILKSRRQNSRVFRLDGKGVCKVMFLNTLAITDRVMGTAIDKSKNGYTEEDNIGKTGSRAYSEAVLETVKNHIKKFPVMESHICEKKANVNFQHLI